MADSMTTASKVSKKKSALPKNAPTVEMAENTMGKSDEARERKWRAEDGLRTLQDAERVKSDKALMADVEKERKRKIAELTSIKCEVSPMTMGKGK